LERSLEINIKDEARLGLAVNWVQQALILVHDDIYPLRPVKRGRQSLEWTSESESLRKGVRRLFNKCRTDMNPLVGNSLEKLKRDIERSKERLLKMFGGFRAFLPVYWLYSNHKR
jgi:hypothetical protein